MSFHGFRPLRLDHRPRSSSLTPGLVFVVHFLPLSVPRPPLDSLDFNYVPIYLRHRFRVLRL